MPTVIVGLLWIRFRMFGTYSAGIASIILPMAIRSRGLRVSSGSGSDAWRDRCEMGQGGDDEGRSCDIDATMGTPGRQ